MTEQRKPSMNNILTGTSSPAFLSVHQGMKQEVDLNQVFQSGMQKHVTHEKKTLSIVRSDKLPVVSGQKEQFVELLDMMIEMIISYPPAGSKLFLYVKCDVEERDPEIMDLSLSKDFRLCTLYFYTNITTDDRWKMMYKDRLAQCAIIAAENQGKFSSYAISNTGCLFSLTLPGKII